MSATATVKVSYAELERLGIHALRGLGYSFSVAERAVRVLAATEAATGLALRYISSASDQLAATSKTVATVETLAPGVTRVDARNKALLEMSPFLLDLLTAEARQLGSAALLVEKCRGMPFIADFSLRARRLGLTIVALYEQAETRALAPFAAAGAVYVTDGAIAGGALSDSGEAWAQAATLLRANGVEAAITEQGRSTGRLLLLAQAPSGGATKMNLLTLRDQIALDPNGPSWQCAQSWPAALDGAIRGQIVSDQSAFDFFNQCVRRIWAPTSERSRAQQG